MTILHIVDTLSHTDSHIAEVDFLLDGTKVTGTFNAGSLSAAGSFVNSNPDAVVTGNWSLTRKLPLPLTGDQTGAFFDVPGTHWAFDYIEKLSASGITAGCGNGYFCPGDAVTRAQMAAFLVRTFGL